MIGRIQQAAARRGSAETADQADRRYELKIATSAITKIAAATAQEVEGLHLTDSSPGALGRFRVNGNSSHEGGVTASLNAQHEVSLALTMTADYGVHIPTLAQDLRDRLGARIAKMTDFETRSVKIEVLDVLVPEESSVPATPES
jgi:uncharacterized alkaline shock family protein YloU